MTDSITVTLAADHGEHLTLMLQAKVYGLLDELKAADSQVKQSKIVYDNARRARSVVKEGIDAVCEFLNQACPEALDWDEASWQEHIGFDMEDTDGKDN